MNRAKRTTRPQRLQLRFSMRLVAAVLGWCMLAEQTAVAAAQPAATAVSDSATSAASDVISLPAGTSVPLTLVSPIKSKSTKVGDAVRAVVAFPIAAGGQVAIPAGTYVEGQVTALTAQAKKTHMPDVQIHFTRLLFANGYTAALDAANTARLEPPDIASPQPRDEEAMLGPGMGSGSGRTKIAFSGGEGFTSRAQSTAFTTPTLPPLPNTERNIFIGASVGMFAVFVTALVLMRHHVSHIDYVLFDAGWQTQMSLTTPLTLDAKQVAAAASTPTH